MSCNNTPYGYPIPTNDCCTDVVQYARFAYSSAQSAYANATEFNKVYLGSFATPPTVDNQGDPLQEGALYYNTSSDEMRVWNGSAWVSLIDLGGDLTINTVRVGLGSGNIGSNTVVGKTALSKNTTGYNNTAIGFSTLAENTTGNENTSVGHAALAGNTVGNSNTAVGYRALQLNTSGGANSAFGWGAMNQNTTGTNNSAFGEVSLYSNTTGSGNCAFGNQTLTDNTTGYANVAIGPISLNNNTTGYENVAIGDLSLYQNTEGFGNVAIGSGALESNTLAFGSIAIGMDALSSTSLVSGNIAIGYRAMENTTTGLSIGIGYRALYNNETGSANTALGYRALDLNIDGSNITAVGHEALLNNTTGYQNTALGSKALISNTSYFNATGIGYNAQVTDSQQVRLGDSLVTAVVSQVGSWSDERDKTDIRDTILGLEFIKELRPVDYKWDYREDYRTDPPSAVDKPRELKEDATEVEKLKYEYDLAAYEAYLVALNKWREDSKLANIVHDGTHKRNRYHHGLIAQELKAVIDRTGIDFGGFQDHTINGGDAAMTVGYTELIGPLIKAVQELSAEVDSLKAQLQS